MECASIDDYLAENLSCMMDLEPELSPTGESSYIIDNNKWHEFAAERDLYLNGRTKKKMFVYNEEVGLWTPYQAEITWYSNGQAESYILYGDDDNDNLIVLYSQEWTRCGYASPYFLHPDMLCELSYFDFEEDGQPVLV